MNPRTSAPLPSSMARTSVRESFGYAYPNYDVVALSHAICKNTGWGLIQTRFYTGVPDKSDDPFWGERGRPSHLQFYSKACFRLSGAPLTELTILCEAHSCTTASGTVGDLTARGFGELVKTYG